jgi:hypothetical protein
MREPTMSVADVEKQALLYVSRQDLARVIEQFERETRPLKKQGASLSYVNGRLAIKSSGVSLTMAASGSWRGVVQVPLTFILTAIRIPPPLEEDRVFVTVRDNRLHIGNSSINCRCLYSGHGSPRSTAEHGKLRVPLKDA